MPVALEGLENILKVGDMEMKQTHAQVNTHANFIDEAQGLDKIENLQNHENQDIYDKAVKILETYYGAEAGGPKDECAEERAHTQ